jgi:phosphatidylglycerophosphate synthase
MIFLRATRDEAAGAGLTVAGLRVVDRALRQLERRPAEGVTLIADGTIPLPEPLPANVELRRDDPPVPAADLPGTVLGADVVRTDTSRLEGGIRVTDEESRRHAEDAVFAALLRPDLGFVARHLNKKISFRVTRHLLCRLPVTPNQVTLGAAVLGLVGCLLIATGHYAAVVAGLALAQLQSILDGCDGELARVRFQQTASGEWLDTVVDDFLNLALIASIGVALGRQGMGGAPGAAATACAMFLVYNAVSYRELVRHRLGGELIKISWWFTRGLDVKEMLKQDGDVLKRLLFALGRRDTFVLGWLVLGIFDLLPLALLWAMLVALAVFVTAIGQVIASRRGAR